MKSIRILLAVLLTVAVASAHYECGGRQCGPRELCHTFHGNCRCVPWNDCHDVTITRKQIGTWETAGCTYTQWDITITNHMDVDIKNIFIGTDGLPLRDCVSIWNIDKHNADGDLTLPSYQPSINAKSAYVFGFILKGTECPQFVVKAVTF